jgi:hypothetical protein
VQEVEVVDVVVPVEEGVDVAEEEEGVGDLEEVEDVVVVTVSTVIPEEEEVENRRTMKVPASARRQLSPTIPHNYPPLLPLTQRNVMNTVVKTLRVWCLPPPPPLPFRHAAVVMRVVVTVVIGGLALVHLVLPVTEPLPVVVAVIHRRILVAAVVAAVVVLPVVVLVTPTTIVAVPTLQPVRTPWRSLLLLRPRYRYIRMMELGKILKTNIHQQQPLPTQQHHPRQLPIIVIDDHPGEIPVLDATTKVADGVVDEIQLLLVAEEEEGEVEEEVEDAIITTKGVAITQEVVEVGVTTLLPTPITIPATQRLTPPTNRYRPCRNSNCRPRLQLYSILLRLLPRIQLPPQPICRIHSI